MRWLALDPGSRWVGVAVCDEEESVATPLPTLRYRGPEALAAAVEALVAGRGVGGVVVGIPLTRTGQGRGEERARGVLAALRQVLCVKVVAHDERGTSREAEERLISAGVPGRRRRELCHGVAAQIILESFLAFHNRQGDVHNR